jgi:hypothetical protein
VKNWLKTQPKQFFEAELKQNMWNTGTGAVKSRGFMLKSDVSFVSVYLK